MLRDVADAAGVHLATASRALNEETRWRVSEATAQRVIAAAEELGYLPNPIARGLATSRSYTVGALIPDFTNPLFPPIMRGIQDGLEAAGYTALVTNTDNDPDRALLGMRAMRARQVDGIISATARSDDPHLEELIEGGPELVLVNRWLPGLPVSSVRADDTIGQRLAVEHLIELGHRRIAYLGAPLAYSTGAERHDALRAAMDEAGIAVESDLVAVGRDVNEAEGARLTRLVLDGGAQRPTAFAAANDLLALGCLDVLAERGIDCPGEVSVTGFGDVPFAPRFQPPLTTVRIPQYEMGATGAQLMLERLGDPGSEPRHVTLEPKLVVRSSTAPLAAGA
ncbi:MAG: LacI family DNA-binding transcriptional regulator [Solirubrobacterales bacterium]|nr:LacI family DNA-binding transcriptional regulator [Solirubrobacterales bacterium]